MGFCSCTTGDFSKYNYQKGMSDRSLKIGFRLTTGLLTVVVLMFVSNAIFNREMFALRFVSMGYPTYIIYPLIIAKILGLTAIWLGRSRVLKEWAYAGFFFNLTLAFLAELEAPDGELFSTSIALACLIVSYYCGSKSTKFFRTETPSVVREL
jgi:hypothetical protein